MANDFDDRSRGDAATFGEKLAVLKANQESTERRQEERHVENQRILNKILDQVIATNGRVQVLEKDKAARDRISPLREKQFADCLDDVETLKNERSEDHGSKRVFMALWGIAVAAGAAILSFVMRRLWP